MEKERREEGDELVINGMRLKRKKTKPGVIYLSTIPPFMQPGQLRQFLEKHGKVTNMHLASEDNVYRKRRMKQSQDRRVRFVEGWVEFEKKDTAKVVAFGLNGKQIGTTCGAKLSKRNKFYFDLWSIKYLKGFKWDYLEEKQKYEKIVARQKLRSDLSKAHKQNEAYLENVSKSKRQKRANTKQRHEQQEQLHETQTEH